MPDDQSCKTCRFYQPRGLPKSPERVAGHCRRRAPTMTGYPPTTHTGWCGEYQLDPHKVKAELDQLRSDHSKSMEELSKSMEEAVEQIKNEPLDPYTASEIIKHVRDRVRRDEPLDLCKINEVIERGMNRIHRRPPLNSPNSCEPLIFRNAGKAGDPHWVWWPPHYENPKP